MKGALVAVLLAGLALAGCSGGKPDAAPEEPRVSKAAESDGPEFRSVTLLEAPVGTTASAFSQAWTVEVPANVTKVAATFVYDQNFLHMGLHMSLDGCGAREFQGPGGTLGAQQAGTWEYPVCGTAEAGPHEFTLRLDAGTISDAVLLLHGDQLVGNGTAPA
jgi:hypothetical protein